MIRHIVSLDAKRGIAKDGSYPWRLPQDMAYFKQQTQSHGGAVLMGRKTFETLGKPLPGRQNFVVTRQTKPIAGVTLVHDLPTFLAGITTDLWVIGGAEIYKQTIALADELYITEIDADFACDQFYPDYTQNFSLQSKSEPQTENGITYRFCIYKPTAL